MDCESFDTALIDALYDELDEVRMRAMERHAEGCAACAAKLAEFRATRERVPQSILLEAPPSGFENRILAAVDVALAKNAPAVAKKEEPEDGAKGGAKIFAFLSRPQFAIAAAFVLVLGAALFVTTSAKKSADAVAQSAPTAAAGGEAREEGEGAKQPSPPPMATATPTVAASGAFGYGAAAAPAAAPTVAMNGPVDLQGAKAFADQGRCAEALPKLETLSKTNAEAELLAARCIQQTQGCKAAVGRFDSAAKRNAGTENGSRATLEAARCYESMGDANNARTRYAKLKTDSYVAAEANDSLNTLNNAAPPAKPPATATAPPQSTKSTR